MLIPSRNELECYAANFVVFRLLLVKLKLRDRVRYNNILTLILHININCVIVHIKG